MKKLLASCALFVVLAVPAIAGDVSTPGKEPPPPPPSSTTTATTTQPGSPTLTTIVLTLLTLIRV